MDIYQNNHNQIYYTIYKTTNIVNKKIYIGVHATFDPYDEYLGSGKYLKHAIKKYGKENFKKEIIELCETEEEMYMKEAIWVDKDFVIRDDTYNIKIGGDGGWSHLKDYWKNKKRPSQSGENHPFYGGISEEHKENMKKPKSNDAKNNIGLGKLGAKNPMFKGYYKTPWGIFESSYEAATLCPYQLSHKTIFDYCGKNIDKTIKITTYTRTLHKNSPIPKEWIGKSPRDIGFCLQDT